ncbi:MAG: rod shape-determining protein RodA [SAR324 cluster bacterium]|nr:rod shape-determining protein RodA [SAR324 cluster bacterium]
MFDRRLLSNFDWFLFFLVLGISLIGVAAIYSASKGYADPTPFWLRQLFWVGMGLLFAFVVLLFDVRTIGNWAYYIHGAVLFSLLLLSAYGSGVGGNSVNRWFLIGPAAVQPSEFAKLSMVLAIAHYFRDSRRVANKGLRGNFWPLVMLLAPFYLIVQQPDLGTALMLLLIYIPIILLAGIRWRTVILMGVAGVVAIVALIASFQYGYYTIDKKVLSKLQRAGAQEVVLARVKALEGQRYYLFSSLEKKIAPEGNGGISGRNLDLIEDNSFRPFITAVLRPYQQKRLITFVNPDYDPLGAGYHIIQSKVAIGSGRFWGKGYGESTQGALNFLPARHTDFLFSIFAEEWGFLGASGLILLYVLLILRGLASMLQTHDRYSSFVLMGVLSIITFQVVINIGMALGLLPVVGVPLPFFSYGGSSMLTMMVGVGLMLNIRMRRFLWA